MLEIRECSEADLTLLDQHIPTGRNDVHNAHFAAGRDGSRTYLVAWQDGVPVGTGVLSWDGLREPDARAALPGRPELANLHVHPPAQGQGVGTALIRAAESLARDRGYTEVAIGVGLANDGAARLYDRLGYTDSGVRATSAYTWYDDQDRPHDEVETSKILTLDLRRG